jgi:hypothetical protein
MFCASIFLRNASQWAWKEGGSVQGSCFWRRLQLLSKITRPPPVLSFSGFSIDVPIIGGGFECAARPSKGRVGRGARRRRCFTARFCETGVAKISTTEEEAQGRDL